MRGATSSIVWVLGALAALATLTEHGRASAEALSWAESTRSPQPATVSPPSALSRACGSSDAALEAAAARLLARKLRGEATPDSGELTTWLRAAGEPHVWPRALVMSGRTLDDERAASKLAAWTEGTSEAGERRCAVASAVKSDGSRVVVALLVRATADLDPLPARAHVGEWLSLSAHLHVSAASARVVIMGPVGAPFTVPSTLHDGHLRARFAPQTQGVFVVQVVGDLESGPRPLLEAVVFADARASEASFDRPAPGEDPHPSADLEASMLRMLDAARVAAGRKPLARDGRLDALARAHVKRAARARAAAHDLGDGDPKERLLAAGWSAKEIGENVAHAASPALAHRALYASASHRANMLSPDFDAAGVAVAQDDDGSVWVVEMFARAMR